MSFPGGSAVICLQCRRPGFHPWVRKIPWRSAWQSTQYSGPENSVDRGAWWATVHGVAKSWTRLSDRACTHTKWWAQWLSQVYFIYCYILSIDQCITLASLINGSELFKSSSARDLERFSYSKNNDVFQDFFLFVPLYTREIICWMGKNLMFHEK